MRGPRVAPVCRSPSSTLRSASVRRKLLVVSVKGLRNLFGRFLSILSARLFTTVVAIITTPIIVRLLGPGEYGDYAVLLSIFSLYMIPVSGAITQGVQKYVSEYRDEAHWREHVVRFYSVLATALGVVAALGLVVFTVLGGTEAVFGAEFSLYFYLLAGFVVVSQFRALCQRIVLGLGLERISGPLDVTQKSVTTVLGISLVLLFGFGVEGMLAGHIIANAVVALSATWVIARQISLKALVSSTSGSFPYRELLSFNALNIVLVLMVMSLYHVDVIMLRTLVGSEETGFYKAALSLAEYLWAVPKALQVVLLHSSSTLWSEDRHSDITQLATRVSRYTILLVLLLAIGLAVLADTVVPLYYGEAFSVATGPLLLLIPGVVGFAAARPLQAIGQGSGQIRTLVVAGGSVAVINVTLNALLIPRFGMNGAAAATSVSYGAMFVFLVWAARQIGFDPLDDIRAVRIAATAAVSAVPIVLLARSIDHELLALAVVPPAGLAIYLAAAVLTGAVTTGEIHNIVSKLPAPVRSAIPVGIVKR